MKRFLVGLSLMMALALTGCGGNKAASASCPSVENAVSVCLDGKPLSWTAGFRPPHWHDPDGYYAPVQDLAKALGAKTMVAPDRKSVSVGGKSVVATMQGAMGIHQHDAIVYAPIKEFAEAAGFQVQVDTKKHVVSIQK